MHNKCRGNSAVSQLLISMSGPYILAYIILVAIITELLFYCLEFCKNHEKDDFYIRHLITPSFSTKLYNGFILAYLHIYISISIFLPGNS